MKAFMLMAMKNTYPSPPLTDALILAGLSPAVMSLSAWLAHEQFHLRQLHVVSTTQGLAALKNLAATTGLPACENLFWHGDEVDGSDGEASQKQFHKIVSGLLRERQENIALQVILGGGVNWMVSIASQIAALNLSENRGDGLWVLKTDPRFENHPHFLKPGDQAASFDGANKLITGDGSQSHLQRVLLVRAEGSLTAVQDERLKCEDGALHFLGQTVSLPPLQLAFYCWLLVKTKQACRRPQLNNCEACYACALPAKNLPSLAQDFSAFYLSNSSKPGYIKHAIGVDFSQRASETISKINTHIRKKVNLAAYRQLKINHTEGGYLPGVDKNYLGAGERAE